MEKALILKNRSHHSSKAHSLFLESRNNGLAQMAELIQLQGQFYGIGNAASHRPAAPKSKVLFDENALQAFSLGDIVSVMGPAYSIYVGRRHPRIPNRDLLLMSRIVSISGERGNFRQVTEIISEYDVPKDAWFISENSSPVIPVFACLEMSLQPCGVLSAYMNTPTLFPEVDFYFRNLDGRVKLFHPVDGRGKMIICRAQLVSNTATNVTILQRYTFQLFLEGKCFFEGESTFGYFAPELMEKQTGLDNGRTSLPWIEQPGNDIRGLVSLNLRDTRNDPVFTRSGRDNQAAHLPTGKMNLLDEVRFLPGGGRYGQGLITASKAIHPEDWFFKCHFLQDPVMPGSLGVEALLESIQVFALHSDLFGKIGNAHFEPDRAEMIWKYRGQVLPVNRRVAVEVHIHKIDHLPGEIRISGDGSMWVDSLRVYEIKPAAIRLVKN